MTTIKGQDMSEIPDDIKAAVEALMTDVQPMTTKLEQVARAIERSLGEWPFGLYDYSNYKGTAPPYVVRDERTGSEILRTNDSKQARETFERLTMEYRAIAAIEAMKGPTPEMVEAGQAKYRLTYDGGLDHEDMAACFDAMLSASLPTTTST